MLLMLPRSASVPEIYRVRILTFALAVFSLAHVRS